MLGLLISVGRFFLNPKVIMVTVAAAVVAGLIGYWSWSQLTIRDLKHTNTELVDDNKKLTDDKKQLVADQKDILDRVELVADAVVDLNTKFSKSVIRRGQSVGSMTTPTPKPGEKPDTVAMEDRANTGMNAVFNELNALSRENVK